MPDKMGAMVGKLDTPKEVEDQYNYWDDKGKTFRVNAETLLSIVFFIIMLLVTLARFFTDS